MIDLSAFFDLPQEALLSQPYDSLPTPDGFRFRALSRARRLAEALVDSKGDFVKNNLDALLSSIEAKGWIYVPKGLSDGAITEHHLLVLSQLRDSALVGKLRQFQLPLCHRLAEDLIRRTLGIPITEKLAVMHLRRAVLAACLTPLRQNVGSCFATAPAILIQRHQTELLIEDLSQLLNTGRLSRVFEGNSYGVPLGTPGDDPLDNALLKSWEYTLASFSEVKMEFTQWNLYTSLGLHYEQSGGIGRVIYGQVEEKIELANESVKQFQAEYEIATSQLRATELLLKQASSEDQIRRLQAEYKSRGHHMQACLELRDQFYSKGSQSSRLYSIFIDQYTKLFPEYFQEIYDANMQEFAQELMQDSPAGFRLLYKHGRRDPSQWTLIYTEEQFVQALVDFFSATEPQIAAVCDWKGGQEEVFKITSAIIHHVRSAVFIESAKERAARSSRAHHPSEGGQKTPWAYTSGGTLTTLVKTYYRRASELTWEEKWVENETELVIFLIDALKLAPPLVTDLFVKEPNLGMLANSPTHAFILRPGFKLFAQGWQEDGFTYTWVRDQVFTPSQQFFSQMSLDQEMQAVLFEEFTSKLPPLLAHQLKQIVLPHHRSFSVKEWRDEVLRATDFLSDRVFIDKLDAFLYEALPVVSGKEVPIYLRRLFSDNMDEQLEAAIASLTLTGKMTAHAVREFAKELYAQVYPHRCYHFDLHQYVADHARFVGLSSPTPLLVADSNWTGYYFGFVVNPGTGRLELWRLDRTAVQGLPMSTWRPWLNGTDRKPWTVFVRPSEYS